jgi:hypothetical protein
MKMPIDSAVHLIHEVGYGTLATHSIHLPGFPFATILPFVPDENHNPLFFISRLAEHTKNLLADKRASFLIARPDGENVQTGPRITLVGEVRQVAPSTDSVARFFRYHPDMRQLASFGDFAFYGLHPLRLRLIAGFGMAGWIEQAAWHALPPLSVAEENAFMADLVECAGDRLLGLDSYGVDIERAGKRVRIRFPEAPLAPEALPQAARNLLECG